MLLELSTGVVLAAVTVAVAVGENPLAPAIQIGWALWAMTSILRTQARHYRSARGAE